MIINNFSVSVTISGYQKEVLKHIVQYFPFRGRTARDVTPLTAVNLAVCELVSFFFHPINTNANSSSPSSSSSSSSPSKSSSSISSSPSSSVVSASDCQREKKKEREKERESPLIHFNQHYNNLPFAILVKHYPMQHLP